MDELVKALSNININSASAEQIGKYWLVAEIGRYCIVALFISIVAITIYKITENFGTGKWK